MMTSVNFAGHVMVCAQLANHAHSVSLYAVYYLEAAQCVRADCTCMYNVM